MTSVQCILYYMMYCNKSMATSGTLKDIWLPIYKVYVIKGNVRPEKIPKINTALYGMVPPFSDPGNSHWTKGLQSQKHSLQEGLSLFVRCLIDFRTQLWLATVGLKTRHSNFRYKYPTVQSDHEILMKTQLLRSSRRFAIVSRNPGWPQLGPQPGREHGLFETWAGNRWNPFWTDLNCYAH